MKTKNLSWGDVERNRLVKEKHLLGNDAWKTGSGYTKRVLVETAFCRYKKILGTMLHGRKLCTQKTEVRLAAKILNKMAHPALKFARKSLFLAEVDVRRRYVENDFSSLFTHLVRRFHFCESGAAQRTVACRLIRRFAAVEGMLRRSEIHLNGLHLFNRHLTDENHQTVLAACAHRSRTWIERYIHSPKQTAARG